MARITLFIFLLLPFLLKAQKEQLSGKIINKSGGPIEGASIVSDQGYSAFSESDGSFSIDFRVADSVILRFSHVGFKKVDKLVYKVDFSSAITMIMEEQQRVLDEVEIEDELSKEREQVSVTEIDAYSAQNYTSAFGEFNSILGSLPGVFINNELSSQYSVRGGNFDENLVYVNGIPVYRPFLIRAGQQEGLSFINPDLVEKVEFSAGGWQPKYGDKLSSVLSVEYKKPKEFRGSGTIGLLGGSAHLEGTANDRLSYIIGFRRKSARYLLNTLETDGEYLPTFTDLQSSINYRLSNRTELGALFNFSRNSYLVTPESRVTDFGTLQQSLRLFVSFVGQEILEYDTFQGGTRLTHQFSDKLKTNFIISALTTREREFQDTEGAYRLCDVNVVPGTPSFDQCIVDRGVGSFFDSGRNILEAQAYSISSNSSLLIDDSNEIQFGATYSYEDIEDQLNEFSFLDSAGFVLLNPDENIESDLSLSSSRVEGFVQHTFRPSSSFTATYGVRFNWWNVNNELLVSPRLQLFYSPVGNDRIAFKGAVGLYQQPPFYRELRDRQGVINWDVEAQKSVHAIAGLDYYFQAWGRDFKLTTEAYYKYLWDVNAYDIDDVRIRYFANNLATAFARGIDIRLNGQFIPGTESWFSLGILDTQEDIAEDSRGNVRRPSDQTINLGINFEDHFANDPSFRVNLALLFGSGLPFSPPRNDELRNSFNGETYRRVDLAFSKIWSLTKRSKIFNTVSARLEILNLLGASNTISYLWIQDVSSNFFAVPNSLSARFLNLKLRIDF
ncbi:MAG: TonB-dependent receptor plug domain-containing protein [Bacteroidota bacterium]